MIHDFPVSLHHSLQWGDTLSCRPISQMRNLKICRGTTTRCRWTISFCGWHIKAELNVKLAQVIIIKAESCTQYSDRVRRYVRSVVRSAYCGKCYLKILCVVFDVATRTRQEESRNESCELELEWLGEGRRLRRQPGQLQQLGLQRKRDRQQ